MQDRQEQLLRNMAREQAQAQVQLQAEEGFLRGKEQEMRDAVIKDNAGNIIVAQTANNLKNKINEVELNAETARGRLALGELPVVGGAHQEWTLKHHLEVTRVTTKEVLANYKQDPNLYRQLLAPDSVGRRVLDQLIARIDNPRGDIVVEPSPYIQKIVHRAINNTITNPLEVLTDDELRILHFNDAYLHGKIVEALTEAARQGGRGEEDIKVFTEREKARSALRPHERGRQDPTEASLVEKLDIEEREFFESLSSPEAFAIYCKKMLDQRIAADPAFAKLSREEQSIQLSSLLRNRVASILYKIYDLVLSRVKTVPFDHAEKEGTFYTSPYYHLELFKDKLGNLKSANFGDFKRVYNLNLMIPQRETITDATDDKGDRLPQYEKVLPKPKATESMSDFMQHLVDYSIAEHKRMSYGYNLEYLFKTGAFDPRDGLMKTIAGFAKGLTNSEIDEIHSEASAFLVQRVVYVFEAKNEQFFTNQEWKKDPMLVDSYFQNLSKLQENSFKYLKQRYGKRFKDWEINRAIFNAQIMLSGVFFKPLHHYSYADPDLTKKGGVTVVGGKELMLSVFDPGFTAKRFQDQETALFGVDFLPINIILENYDYNIWKAYLDALKESMTKGKAAYAYHLKEDGKGGKKIEDLAGDDFLKVKLGVDIGNIAEAGGVDTLSRWRLFSAWKDWVRKDLDSAELPKYKDKDGKEDPYVFVKMWKKIENIGSDVLENMTIHKYVHGLAPDKGKGFDEKKEEEKAKSDNLLNLFDFLYDRYFSTDFGKVFIKKEGGGEYKKDEFREMIKNAMNNKDYYKYEKQELLMTYLYHAFSVIMFERMPLKYVFLEKPRLTQNGSRLFVELDKEFVGDNSEKRKDFDQALDDLILVQTELRISTMEEMEHLAKTKDNLFGDPDDLSKLRSDVNQGKGYVIDEEVIERILRSEFDREEYRKEGGGRLTEEEKTRRINHAKEIYRNLQKKLKDKPIKANWEEKIIKDGEPANADNLQKDERKKILNMREKYLTRAEWFSKLYRDMEFGFSPTSGELAFKFLNFSATGSETIERAANFCADTAEKIATDWGKPMFDLVREAKEKRDLKEVLHKIWEIKQGVRSQWGTESGPPGKSEYYSDLVAYRLLQRVIYYFRKNDITIPPLEWAINKSSSFSEEDTGGPRTGGAAFEASRNMIDKLIAEATGAGSYKLFDHEAKQSKILKRTTLGEQHKILGKLLEKVAGHPIPREIHDWANEISGRAQKHVHASDFVQLLKYEVSIRFLIILAVILGILGIKGFQQSFDTGGRGN